MNLLRLYQTYRQTTGNQWLPREKILKIQESKLRQVIRHACINVPFYAQLFEENGITPDRVKTLEDLQQIPVTTKSDLQKFDSAFIVSRAFSPDKLKIERSSGSTGSPFSVFLDKHYVHLRNTVFLRALSTVGYRLGRKILLVTDGGPGKLSKPWLNWYYASILDPPEVLAEKINQLLPEFLYGCTTPLRQLAEFVQSSNTLESRTRIIITTAEVLDRDTRKLLEETFDSEVYDFYGLTEMGLVGWECTEHSGYHLAEDSTFVEFLPLENGAEGSRLVMTNLNLLTTPFIRFDTGDIGISNPKASCPCGRSFVLLQRVEGRIVDSLHLKNGTTVSPYKITCELEKLPNLQRFHVIQEDYNRITVRVETDGRGSHSIEDDIRGTMKSVLGENIEVTVFEVDHLQPPPGRKFRAVESKLRSNYSQ